MRDAAEALKSMKPEEPLKGTIRTFPGFNGFGAVP